MPTVACPRCLRATVLPEPWPHAGFVCACGATVAVAGATPAAPEPNPFAVGDGPPARPARRDYAPARPRQAGHGSSAFMTMLGGSLGCFAGVVVVLVGLAFLASK